MDEKNASLTRVLGVTLQQYAGIQTALAQGFPLDDALRNERLSATRWTRVRTAWGDKLAREGHGGPLSAAFLSTSAEAAEWLGRRIAPLDDDLGAWCGFLGAYAAEPAPSTLLRRLGLRGDDVQRLAFAWKVKTDSDPSLAKKAAAIAATKPCAVPNVRITEGALRPFPWSPGPEAPRPAAVRAPSAAASAPAPAPSPAVPVLEVPSFLRAIDAAPVPPPPLPLPAAGIGETVSSFTLPLSAAAALPFNAGAPASPAAVVESGDAARPSAGSWTGTAAAFELPKGPAVPFRPGAASAPAPTPREKDAIAAPAAPTPDGWSTGTAMVFELPRSLVIPFRPATAAASPAATAPAAPVPTAAPPPAPAAPTPPALTLEQHASLCAELAFRPDEQPRILSRYRVTGEAKQALDRLYRDRNDRSAAWDTAYRTYFEWLSSQEKSKV